MNPRHLACTEIRAAALSGDCFLWKEWFNRLNFGLAGHQKVCVKRKAADSMMAVTNGKREVAEKYIDEVSQSTLCLRAKADLMAWLATKGARFYRTQSHALAVCVLTSVPISCAYVHVGGYVQVFDQCYADTAPFDKLP